jgi:hypothetical protein
MQFLGHKRVLSQILIKPEFWAALQKPFLSLVACSPLSQNAVRDPQVFGIALKVQHPP